MIRSNEHVQARVEHAIARWPSDLPLAAILHGPTPTLAIPDPPRPIRDAKDCRFALDVLDSTDDGLSVGLLPYGLGRLIEPSAGLGKPASVTGWCALCHSAWQWAGTAWQWIGIGPERPLPQAEAPANGSLGPVRSATGRSAYTNAVARAVELIHAGDVFQVNLAHELVGTATGSSRAIFADLVRAARPAEGMYLEHAIDGVPHAICSLSPELFLDVDLASRAVGTEPMKGTRPGTADPAELEASSKDAAELAMITDLMRNDLGRVCGFGSIAVQRARNIRPHATGVGKVFQATSEVRGVLRQGVSLGTLIDATFPPGSITGAPKIRAMQIIDELEPTPRGSYCGSAFWVHRGQARFNVLIRTLELIGDRASYRVGAGIVAESDPESEWRETLDKAGVLRSVTSIEETP